MNNNNRQALNIGVIGYGGRGTLYTALINLNPLAKVKAICDTDRDLLTFYESLGMGGALYDDLDAMLEEADLNAVFICTPNSSHFPIAEKCASRGLHVFSEIPLAESYGAAQNMLASVLKKGIIHSAGHYFPYQKTFEKAKSLLSAGLLGRIRRIRASLYRTLPLPFKDGWILDKEISGGGVLISLGTDLFQILQWYFGPVESLFAQASTGTLGVEEGASIILNHVGGIQAYCDVSWRHPGFPFPTARLIIEGMHGIMEISSDDIKLHLYRKTADFKKGWTTIHRVDLPSDSEIQMVEEGFYESCSAFIESCLGNKRAHVTWEESTAAMKIVEACYRSIKQNKVIRLDRGQQSKR